MRVIAGSLRGRGIQGPDPGDYRVRPTSDRAREALFSILQKWPTGPFLDLCGGTGAVALEAHSRGYDPVHSVERQPEAVKLMERNVKGTPIRVVRKDVLRLTAEAFPPQAIIFADPPYEASGELWRALGSRLQSWLRKDGLVVWETDAGTDLPPCEGLSLVDVRRYGAARFHFFAIGGEQVER